MLAMQDGRVKQVYSDRGAVPKPTPSSSPRPAAKPQVSFGNRVSAFVCIGFCTAILWFLAGMNAKIEVINDGIYHTQVEIQTMNAQNAGLNAKVDKLTQPTRILNIAVNQLHMKYQTPVVIPSHTP